jgi:hypothetical protein
MSAILWTLDDKTREQVKNLVRVTGKPEEAVLRELVKAGLKTYKTAPTKGVQALLDLAKWAEENNVTGPKDLSTNHDKYAWGE